MPHRMFSPAQAVVLLALAGLVCGASDHSLQLHRLEDGTEIQVALFWGTSKWAAPRHIFTSSHILVECGGVKDFRVYVEPSVTGLQDAHAAHDVAWCGWQYALGNDRTRCYVPVSPFGPTAVGVLPPLAAGRSTRCTARRSDVLSSLRMGSAVLGTLLFWNAATLALSTPFRLTSGSLGFVALSALILLFVLYRSVPHKKRLLAAVGLLGSTFLGVVRYMFGTWVPALRTLASNPLVIAYVVLSAAVGLVITYWFNDTSSVKVNTILRVALRVLGLGIVVASASLPEGSVALVAALLLASLWRRMPGSQRAWPHSLFRVLKLPATGQALPASAGGRDGGRRGDAPRPEEPGREDFVGHDLDLCHAAPAGSGRSATRLEPKHSPGEPSRSSLTMQGAEETPVTPVASAQPLAASPMIPQGKVLNEATGHLIGVGKATYNRLVEQGYIVDAARGIITPPPKAAANGGGTGGTPSRRRRAL